MASSTDNRVLIEIKQQMFQSCSFMIGVVSVAYVAAVCEQGAEARSGPVGGLDAGTGVRV